MLDTVDDLILIGTEDNVAVFSHDFHNQIFPAQIPHVIQMLNLETKDTFHGRLGDRYNSASADMLS